MLTSNPFAELTAFLPPLVMQIYVILMIVAVAVGTWFDTYHKGSAEYFARRQAKARAAAKRPLGGGEKASVLASAVAEAATSAEFGPGRRRISHLLTMYGFILYVITTAVMVFGYADEARTPAVWPTLWVIGALMILVGGLWYFFIQRVNVAYDGDPPWRLGRADIFIVSLILTAAFALIWHAVQTATDSPVLILLFFGLWLLVTTVLFVTVPWSKFAHMFYKPAVAYQRKVEEASGASDLPAAAFGRHQARR